MIHSYTLIIQVDSQMNFQHIGEIANLVSLHERTPLQEQCYGAIYKVCHLKNPNF